MCDAILGIDAAWSSNNQSGVALIKKGVCNWSCIAVTPSYTEFVNYTNNGSVNWNKTNTQHPCNPNDLLDKANSLLNNRKVTLVSIDIPLAISPITGRRKADEQISSAFGSKGCSTHTPNAIRPGNISTTIYNGFTNCGYPLAITDTKTGCKPALVEVYPHPAILKLLNISYRFPYKVSKSNKYWPLMSINDRIGRLLCNFYKLLEQLSIHIKNIPRFLPDHSNIKHLNVLKPYEDAIDALVCAWVGICYLKGNIQAYGDDTAAIWVPT